MLQIKAKDGDLGEARPVVLSLEEDTLNYFKLVKNTLVTSHVPIDRENPLILQNGGIYTFKVKVFKLFSIITVPRTKMGSKYLISFS